MDTLDDPRVIARARASKRRLVFWIIVMMITISVCGLIRAVWLGAVSDVTTMVVSAKPGETVQLQPSSVQIDVRVEMAGKELPIGGDYIYLEDQGAAEVLCQNGAVTARGLYGSDPRNLPSGLYLVNHCNADVTLKACWYNATSWLRFLTIPLCE